MRGEREREREREREKLRLDSKYLLRVSWRAGGGEGMGGGREGANIKLDS